MEHKIYTPLIVTFYIHRPNKLPPKQPAMDHEPKKNACKANNPAGSGIPPREGRAG